MHCALKLGASSLIDRFARIYGSAEVFGSAKVHDNAWIYDCTLSSGVFDQ